MVQILHSLQTTCKKISLSIVFSLSKVFQSKLLNVDIYSNLNFRKFKIKNVWVVNGMKLTPNLVKVKNSHSHLADIDFSSIDIDSDILILIGADMHIYIYIYIYKSFLNAVTETSTFDCFF